MPNHIQRKAALTAKIARIQERRQAYTTMLAELVASGESPISLTDSDARGMATHPKVGVGYNAQVAVDAKYKLIVEQHVTNTGSDLGRLAQTAGASRELTGVERINAVAAGRFVKDEFAYGSAQDFYRFPGGRSFDRFWVMAD